MAQPITTIHKRVLTEEEMKQQKLEELKTLLADNDEALNQTLEIVRELHKSGMLEAASSMLKAKEKIAKIAIGQVSREPVTNLINNAIGAAEALTNVDPEVTTKLINSVVKGMNEANEHAQSPKQIGLFDLLKALKDPDINRAIGFGMQFLKGLGKGLKD
jgi:uncharacterized protein YjgD (DUF1641 family)